MALLTKPDMQQVWASGGDIVEPSDLKKQQGWTVEVPPHQFENWIQNRQDEYLAHINQRGIPQWDGNTEYEAAGLSYVQGSNGTVYKSVAASGPATTVQNPTTDLTDTYWTVAFASQDLATESVPGIVEIATASEAQTFTANKIIDGAKLASAFMGVNVSLTTNGYQKLPSGLIIQWASYSHPGYTNGQVVSNTLNFPIAFPNAVLYVGRQVPNDNYARHSVNPSGLTAWTWTLAVSPTASGANVERFYAVGF